MKTEEIDVILSVLAKDLAALMNDAAREGGQILREYAQNDIS